MNKQASHTNSVARLAEAPSGFMTTDSKAVLVALTFISIVLPIIAVSVSPVVGLISILIALPILISGIINLILIIS